MMEEEFVRRRGWLSHAEFLDMLGATNLIPGPNSTEMAIHIGHQRAGWKGLVVGGVCFIVPAMLIVMAAAWAYVRFGSLPQFQGIMYGIKPVIVAIILQALWRLGSHSGQERISRPGWFDCGRGRDARRRPADDSLRRGYCRGGDARGSIEGAAPQPRPRSRRLDGRASCRCSRARVRRRRSYLSACWDFFFFFSRSARCFTGAATCCSPSFKRTSWIACTGLRSRNCSTRSPSARSLRGRYSPPRPSSATCWAGRPGRWLRR